MDIHDEVPSVLRIEDTAQKLTVDAYSECAVCHDASANDGVLDLA